MKTHLLLLLLLITSTGLAQPANNDCSSPTNITDLDGTCNSYSNVGATFDTYIGGCMGDANNVWFTFTAQGTDADITVSGINRPEIAVIAPLNGPCNITDNVQVGCTAPTGNYSSVTLTLNNLTVGYTYYIIVTNNTGGGGGAGTYNICVDNPVTAAATVSCSNATAFCTVTPQTYPASTNAGSGQLGPDYDCLAATPNPAWFYLEIATAGDLDLQMSSSPAEDIDFVMWGPIADLATGCIDELYGSNSSDCSFSAVTTESTTITGASIGETYIVMITNFSNNATDITFSQTGGTGATDCSIVLPVDLLSFEGKKKNNGINLSWETASESNSDYYTIERFALGQGSNKYIGTVDAAGNSSSVLSYEIFDDNVEPGRYMYRLTQYDLNGEVGEKKNIIVDVKTETDLNIFPNPTSNIVNLNLTSDISDSHTIVIYDLSGRQVFSQTMDINKGYNDFVISPNLKNGAYVLKIANKHGLIHSERLIVNP